MNEPRKNEAAFLARRRQLLKMGAAGMPMLLTLKASATQVVNSALDCAITIPDGLCILVSVNGAAWISTSYTYDGQGLTAQKVAAMQNQSQYVLPAGVIPDRYRPDEYNCQTDPCDDGSSGGDDDNYLVELLNKLTLSSPVNAAEFDDAAVQYASNWNSGDDDDEGDDCSTGDDDDDGSGGSGHGSGGGGGDDDDDDDDDDDGSGGGSNVNCEYKIYCYEQTQFTPGDFLDANGNWNLSGDLGLYTIAVAKYGEFYGSYNSFPGVSCILSILTYLNTR